jgi:hypothetical protein
MSGPAQQAIQWGNVMDKRFSKPREAVDFAVKRVLSGKDAFHGDQHMKQLTTKQFGDACEMHVITELMFSGRPALKMPDGWRGYDVIAETDDGPTRISVKGMRFDSRRSNRSQAGWWAFNPNSEWDWLALDVDDGTRQTWIVPRAWALAHSAPRPEDQRAIHRRDKNGQLARFANNFALSNHPPERPETSR